MNGKSSATNPKIDLSGYSDSELESMIPAIEKELEERTETRRREALEKIRAAAAEVGMTPEELLGIGGGKRKRSRRTQTAWQHPDDPSKIYRGGRKPAWLQELEGEGRAPVKVE